MIIINADDWGRSRPETDAAMACYERGRITSVSAMVFMEDSERSAELAKTVGLDVGLHVNLSQRFTAKTGLSRLSECHAAVVGFLARNKYALLFYHPRLREAFRYVYDAQAEEFERLYGRRPSHIDGHQHKHLCTMLLDRIIPAGEHVRRSFTFQPNEKSWLNRTYRHWVDQRLASRHRLTDFFFSLSRSLEMKTLDRVFQLAKASTVELMTHPANQHEFAYLRSDECEQTLSQVSKGNFTTLVTAGQN
jgi:predicted glycoside hydrolase/deacetylase ChbG (UPF0249 family)